MKSWNGIQDYNDASMEPGKEEIIVKDDDGIEDDWNKTMEISLQKGINCLLQTCHLNQIQE